MKFADGVKGARTGLPLFRPAGLPAQQAVQQQDHGQGRKPGEPYRRQDLHGGGGAGRSAAQVVGMSWREAVFIATKVTMALLALSLWGFNFCSSRMAARPKGVAALPRPSRLAERFMEMACMAGLPCGTVGNSHRVRGRSSRANASVRRQRRAISIRPLHRHSIPVRAMTRLTASPQPESAAAESASIRPVKAAVTTEKISRAVRIPFIMGGAPFFNLAGIEMNYQHLFLLTGAYCANVFLF